MLRIVDVSNWKSDFDASITDYDGIVPIVTYGAGELTINGIENSVWHGGDPMIQSAIARNKVFGYVHYIRGVGADEEATFFASNTTGYLHKGVPSFDWESGDNVAWGNQNYLDEVVRKYIELTGVQPLLYTSVGTSSELVAVAKKYNCGLWLAQYANNDATGWQDEPWNEGAYTCAMRQYTSNGYIDGYSGRLDLNKFYGDVEAWNKYAHAGEVTPVPTPEPTPTPTGPDGTTMDLVYAVMKGQYGNGSDRQAALGSRYQEVQDTIDHIADASTADLVQEVLNNVYGVGEYRQTVFGSRYQEVQDAVNAASEPQYDLYIVQSGDTLSGIANKFGTTYQKIADDNGIADPNRIYPGQQLIIK